MEAGNQYGTAALDSVNNSRVLVLIISSNFHRNSSSTWNFYNCHQSYTTMIMELGPDRFCLDYQ